uniref:syndecan-4-like n=1 Tax=Centroberyx gerrardi TaxID=166262 RepID=UPI003AAE5BCD
MRIFWITILLFMDSVSPICMSFSIPPEDLDGSGYDLDSSGSGSGDWSEQDSSSSARFTTVIPKKIKNGYNTNDERVIAAESGGGTRNNFHDDSELIFDIPPWTADDISGDLAKSRSFLENKEILAGIIAGGVTGLTLATAVVAIIIYKWQKKDVGGYTQGALYQKPKSKEFIA